MLRRHQRGTGPRHSLTLQCLMLFAPAFTSCHQDCYIWVRVIAIPRFPYSDFSQENRDPRETTLFLEKGLKVGMNKILHFPKSEFRCASPFLSRDDADAIPFSSAELPCILQRFSFPLASSEAIHVGVTLKCLYCNESAESACSGKLHIVP
ncbi:hypothetical protein AMTR_s00041p00237050 [Amborella trichopoda]|uniref:BURP domain-containing protein n=1 Tax=Amborella trichopoda TaxID=13333 RepID=W1PZP9_AMBTC|nr:hypothetical protein AMTR_s00041p00237050 [Amborella trichopoda]